MHFIKGAKRRDQRSIPCW